MRTKILKQPIDVYTKEEVQYIVKAALAEPKQLRIVTLNPEMVITAFNNFELQAAINNADLIVPDGTGIVWALKKEGISDAKRIPGIELTEVMLDSGNKLGKKVAIFGSNKDTLKKATYNLSKKYPDINFVKAIDGYQGKEKDTEIAIEISKENPDIILVALGTPNQEVWINKHYKLFPKSILIGVGGSIDIFSGEKKRAPLWIRENNLEWVYRMITEPKRTIRILSSLPVFILKTLMKTNN
ncbi:MAG: WecB/TagA/CpsF family glycosyltransferase [Candidatus Melainabacteria bacterium]|nr:WecB/TagA/CpsF family glycosyltransferase [Candidatus Melainabacteria bacterium]